MTFRVGQEVVCVDNKVFRQLRPTETIPEVGVVYTIRDIFLYKGKPQLLLVEPADDLLGVVELEKEVRLEE